MVTMDTKLADAMPLGVMVVNQQGVIRLVNKACCTIFKYTSEELIGNPLEILLPDMLRKGHSTLIAYYFQNPESRLMGQDRALNGQQKDGALVPIEVGLNPYKLDGEDCVLATIIDITHRQSLESKVLAYTKQLEEQHKLKDGLIEKLQVALEEVKMLQELIPVCSKCKKVKDSEGYWEAIEVYFRKQSGANFTHGYCPECFEAAMKEIEGK